MPKKKRSKDEIEMEVDESETAMEVGEPEGDDAEMEESEASSPSGAVVSHKGKNKKRRRPTDTAELTPESQIKKKAKASLNTTGTRAEEKKGDDETQQQQQLLPDASSVNSPQVINGDASAFPAADLLEQQPVVAANVVGTATPSTDIGGVGSPEYSPETSVEPGRKLFGATPSPVNVGVAPPTSAAAVNSPKTAAASPQATSQATSPQVAVHHATNGHHPAQQQPVEAQAIVESRGVVTFFWMCFFGCLFLALLPYSVDLADMAVPMESLRPALNETEIYAELERKLIAELPDYEPQIVVEEESIEEEETKPEPEISAAILEAVSNLQTLQDSLEQSKRGLDTVYAGIEQKIATVISGANEAEATRAERMAENDSVANKLQLAVDDEDLSSSSWKEAIASTDLMSIVDTTLINFWEIGDPVECPAASTTEEAVAEVAIDPNILTPSYLQEQFDLLLEKAYEGAESLKKNPATELMAREWVRSRIESDITSDADTMEIIKELTAPIPKTVQSNSRSSGGNSGGGIDIDEIEEIISYRLEMERADKTGQFDHASLLNGAQVIYGGKRGTSDSLIDSLPLYNRVMQVSKLQFYGYGPEVSIIPTWPPDALGQCWSFQQPPIKELLKRKRNMGDDDHKRGSFGTLTISLPHPVNVKSVVIEHPPKGLTDNANSAVRAFRVIGYGDAMATEKSWSLGSFEYDINSKKPMQEFEVATEIFRTLVPPLQSITLAIDSNWGFDYACLYRFRVHGELEE